MRISDRGLATHTMALAKEMSFDLLRLKCLWNCIFFVLILNPTLMVNALGEVETFDLLMPNVLPKKVSDFS